MSISKPVPTLNTRLDIIEKIENLSKSSILQQKGKKCKIDGHTIPIYMKRENLRQKVKTAKFLNEIKVSYQAEGYRSCPHYLFR